MLFWVTEERTQVVRTLVEAPSIEAANIYGRDKGTDWDTAEATVEYYVQDAETTTAPDVTVDAEGNEIENERDRDDNDSK